MEQQWERQGYPPLAPLPAQALILFQQEIAPRVGPPHVGLATLAPGGARVLFVVCQAGEWSCHISSDFSSDFSPCGPLSEFDHSPRVSFSVLVGCLGLREAFSLVLEVPFPSAGDFRLQLFFYISSSRLFQLLSGFLVG